MTPLLAGVLAYVAAQMVVAAWVSRRIATETDYLAAGRSLSLPLATASIFATWFGAETCLGAAGKAYEGVSPAALTEPLAYGLCLVLSALLFARVLSAMGVLTVADLFAQRFSPGTARFAALLMIPTSILWAAAQIRAFGQVLAASSALATETAVALATVIVIAYTVGGGLYADAVTDVVQGVVLALGLAVMLLLALTAEGQAPLAAATVHTPGPAPGPLAIAETWAVPVLGSVLAQELVSRQTGARSPRVAVAATWFGAALYVAVGLMPLALGWLGRAHVPELADSERILPLLAREFLPVAGYVAFMGALVSAILSTVDSALLSAGALFSRNVVGGLHGAADGTGRVRLARAGVIASGVVAYVLALRAESILALVEDASAFGSAGLFVAATAGLFTRFGGTRAASACLASGALAWAAGTYAWETRAPFLVSLAAAAAAYGVVGLVEAPKQNSAAG